MVPHISGRKEASVHASANPPLLPPSKQLCVDPQAGKGEWEERDVTVSGLHVWQAPGSDSHGAGEKGTGT